jgi:hypothetical protein
MEYMELTYKLFFDFSFYNGFGFWGVFGWFDELD